MILEQPTIDQIIDLQNTSPEPSKEVVIAVRDVSKMYRIYDRPQDRLKQMIWRGRRAYGHEFWALRNASFEVRKGETVGIVGRNGSGKSTLLQIIAGTLTPTEGEIQVNGRVTALLELGSGFNPEFTGRENVFLNGAILGVSRAEMDARINEIIAFADIGDFIDQPTKIYSSGMVVRLAFAVQACLEPDILIVDEALSVGDMYFQTKCMAKIAELRKRGTSILFVSHAVDMVKAICSRAILLDHGQVVAEGHPDPVTDRYIALTMGANDAITTADVIQQDEDLAEHRSLVQPQFDKRISERFGNGKARYIECQIFQNGHETDVLRHGSPCEVHGLLAYNETVAELGEVGVVVRTLDGLDLFAANSFLLREVYPPQLQGTLVRIVFSFEVILAPGVYSVSLGYRAPVQGEYVDKVYNAAIFRVETPDGRLMPFRFSIPSDFAFEVVDDFNSAYIIMLELFPSPQIVEGFDTSVEYSDGDSEERLLALFSQGDEQALAQEIQRMLHSDLPWSELIHLSPQRHHLLDWYPFRSDTSLLELGAGCGALTSLFCDRVAHVEAVDLSMRRAQILLRRHRNRSNLRVLIGDLASLVARQPHYDYVTAIGVLEYAGRYVHAQDLKQPFAAYLQFLRDIYTVLVPGGTLLLAIENQLGAKYLAGSAEDHYGAPLVSIEDYSNDAGIRTFGKAELLRLIEQAGLHVVQIYYPVPDYKMPTTIYSDILPPGSTEHISLLYSDSSQVHGSYFDEGRFMRMAQRNGLATIFANSFLVECQR